MVLVSFPILYNIARYWSKVVKLYTLYLSVINAPVASDPVGISQNV